MPTNSDTTTHVYTLELMARAAGGGNRKAYVTVNVSPVMPPTGVGTAVAAGGYHACALLSNGHVECWGYNVNGQLGDGVSTGPESCQGGSLGCSTTPVEVKGIANATQVTAGEDHTCALLSTGHIECWGANAWGQLGDGTTTHSNTPVEVKGITDATRVSGGGQGTCALLSTGHVTCWGANYDGQLGDGTSTGPETCEFEAEHHLACSRTPVEVAGITGATRVAGGGIHACALLATGHVMCWGYNGQGQLGHGPAGGPESCTSGYFSACSRKPVEAEGVTGATMVAAGFGHTCALLSTGHVECWGLGVEGQLGGGNGCGCDTPVEAKGISNATQITAGEEHTCALLSTGHVECWGYNAVGQLGNDATSQAQNTPVEVTVITHATQVIGGGLHTCALLATGHAMCWGANYSGQLGDGTTVPYSDEPVYVSDI